MTTIKVDRDGRFSLPKELEEKVGAPPGAELEVRWQRDHLEIEPSPRKVHLEQRGLVMVAVPNEPGPVLTDEMVRGTLEKLRDRDGED